MHSRDPIANGTYLGYRVVNFEARSRMELVWLVMHGTAGLINQKSAKLRNQSKSPSIVSLEIWNVT